jgi:hypothetical protein
MKDGKDRVKDSEKKYTRREVLKYAGKIGVVCTQGPILQALVKYDRIPPGLKIW